MHNATSSRLPRFLFFAAAVLLTFAPNFPASAQEVQQAEQTKESNSQREDSLKKIREAREASFKHVFKLKISAGKYGRINENVIAPVWFKDIGAYPIEMVDEQGNKIYGEFGSPLGRTFMEMVIDLKNPLDVKKLQIPVELTFLLPELKAGKSVTYTCRRIKHKDAPRPYKWDDDHSKVATLNVDGTPIFRSMYEKVDNSSQERRNETYKVYHHVFSPDGSRLLTKGPGGKFPHHRGIFFGYNRISYDFGESKKADIWHLKKGESQIAEAMTHQSGISHGRSIGTISWKGQNDLPFAIEQRDMLFSKTEEATCVDIRISLSTTAVELKLEGDPQHAGVQFRASQLVPDHTAKMTYYLRPDGKADPGDFRNWSNKKDESDINKANVDLPWHAICFALPEMDEAGNVVADSKSTERFTVCRLNASSNPKPARYSERNYGRFGSYTPVTVSLQKPLNLDYRYWIFKGEKTVEEMSALSDRYENPVTVEVVAE